MNSLKRGQIIKNTLIIIVVLLVATYLYVNYLHKELFQTDNPVGNFPPVTVSTWLVDWDYERSFKDTLAVKERLSSIQLFFAYFDESDRLIWDTTQQQLVEQTIEQLSSPDQQGFTPPLYLTVINDIKKEDGSSVQKDPELVHRLINNQETQYYFTEQMISIVKEYGLSGIEIDFENLTNLEPTIVAEFFEQLYNRLLSENIALRIVIEPKMKFEQFNLPVGPHYVVMAYNFHGYHSGPGPKADLAFISKLTARMEHLPTPASVAIATGGFTWSESGVIKSISELEATELQLRAHEDTLVRDEVSQALTFYYTNEQGELINVWYADHLTLIYWIEVIQQRGFSDIAIWRMGSLSEETLLMLSQYHR